MDPSLVSRAQEGDEVAFALITRAMSARFNQVAFRILRDRHLAEDAVQQALVDIWRKLPTLRDPERFDGWSYRFLVHACYREGKRYRDAFRELPGTQDLTHPDATRVVSDRDQLERGFRRLSVDHRAVVVMHYYLDLSIEGCAEALGISAGTAKSRLNRAMAQLRLALHTDIEARRKSREEGVA
jgi:RNA polymerase sigma-70 factor (ECF subfamily)